MKSVGKIFREKIISEIKTNIDSNESVFLLSYSNLNSLSISDFRKQLNDAGASVYVSKNRIASLALKDLKHDGLADKVSNQTAFVWGNADSAEISKILVEFAKKFEDVKVKGGLLDGRELAEADIKTLSDLPSKEVLLSTLLSTIQAPVTRILNVFNAKSRDLLSILNQLSEKKGGSENG